MRITLFIGGLGAGGAERVMVELANHLSTNHKVTLITMSSEKAAYLLDKRVKQISLDNSLSSRILKNIGRIKVLIKYVKKNPSDFYIAFLPITSYLILGLRSLIKGKIVFSVRNAPSREYAGRWNKFLYRRLFPKADGIVFQTLEAKNYFDKVNLKSCRVIANPISEEFLKLDGRPICKKEKRIISVGRLAPQKNYALLIQAFAEIADRYKDYSLVIFGEGRERENLQHLIEKRNLVGRCFLPGKTKQVREELQKSELYISSSDFEGISNALLEAMAVGLPVISTDWEGGGARLLIQDNINGILIPTGDKLALAEAMDRVLSDEQKRRGLADNAIRIKEKFSPGIIYEEWERYLNVLQSDQIRS